MTTHERLRRIAAMQDDIDRLIDSCEDGDCCPCPTCEALDDVAMALVVARGRAAWVADR